MEDHKLFHERYFLERLLGRGNFSEVWLAKDTKTDITVALKIYAPATGLDDHGLNVFAREFSLVANVNHKNLLKPLYYDSCDRKPYLVLPYCKNGSIMKDVGKFDEKQAWALLRDVASGLAWLHAMNPPVVHQDIKPDNIMVGDNGEYMITDFGVSAHLRSTLRKSLSSAFTSAGTIAYMAPERFGKDNTPIMANDIYSLGATAYEMITGDTPFGDDGGLVQKKGAEVPDIKGKFSPQLNEVLQRCLRLNPWDRPTAEQLAEYAETGLRGGKIHYADEKPFFQKYKKFVIAGAVAAVVLIAVIIGVVVNQQKAAAEKARVEQVVHRNDSIAKVANGLKAEAQRQVVLGDKNEEYYENRYIDALTAVDKALATGKQLTGTSASLVDTQELEQIRKGIIQKLQTAYEQMQQKADLFKDDAVVANDFKDRAAKISKALGTKKQAASGAEASKQSSIPQQPSPAKPGRNNN